MVFNFGLAFAISVQVLMLIVVIKETVRVKFSKKTLNEFTLKPYYLINIYLLSQIIQNSHQLAR